MLSRHGRLRAVVAAAGLIVSMFAVQAALSTPAQARCRGVDNRLTSTLNIGGAVAVSEVPVNGTCNDNNYYQSNFKSNYSGWRASVWINNDNTWVGHFGGYNTAWNYMEYWDNNSPLPGTSQMHFCLDNGTTWYCGWGNDYNVGNSVNHNYNGINYGF